MSKDLVRTGSPDSGKGQFLVYEAENGQLKIDVRLEDETVWLTQQLLADLFQTTKQNISLHIQRIFEEGELVPGATVKKYLTVRREGNREVSRLLDYYNLDMIISVLQVGPFPFPDFPCHADLMARYAKDTGINLNAPEAVMLFMADSPAYPQSRYYQDASIRAAFEEIIRCRLQGEPPRVLLAMATGSGKTIIAANLLWRLHKAQCLPIRGPMVPLTGAQGLVENGLVEQAVEFIKRNTGVETHLKDGVRREDRWTYPEEAIRETIVNALVHRDYLLSGSDIEVSIYEDRLEVGSPGRLPNGITPERMLIGCRAARNQLLKDVMRDYGYLEHMGMGVPRKIVKSMQAHNGTMPDLIVEDERFVIRLLNP